MHVCAVCVCVCVCVCVHMHVCVCICVCVCVCVYRLNMHSSDNYKITRGLLYEGEGLVHIACACAGCPEKYGAPDTIVYLVYAA